MSNKPAPRSILSPLAALASWRPMPSGPDYYATAVMYGNGARHIVPDGDMETVLACDVWREGLAWIATLPTGALESISRAAMHHCDSVCEAISRIGRATDPEASDAWAADALNTRDDLESVAMLCERAGFTDIRQQVDTLDGYAATADFGRAAMPDDPRLSDTYCTEPDAWWGVRWAECWDRYLTREAVAGIMAEEVNAWSAELAQRVLAVAAAPSDDDAGPDMPGDRRCCECGALLRGRVSGLGLYYCPACRAAGAITRELRGREES